MSVPDWVRKEPIIMKGGNTMVHHCDAKCVRRTSCGQNSDMLPKNPSELLICQRSGSNKQ